MINILKDFYNISDIEYKEYNDSIIFCINGINYYLVKTFYEEKMVDKIYGFSLFLLSKNIHVHEFVFNNKNTLLSDGYVLFKVNTLICDIDFNDISLFNIIINDYNDLYVSFDKFWESKIDYLELQLSELSFSKLINNSFDYFVGVSELLLSFYKDNYYRSNNLYLVHKSFDNLCTLDFYNPLNITVGCRYKDYVSYIKKVKDYDLLYKLIENVEYNEIIYIFTRMCFPFKYFEVVSNVLLDEQSDDELINIVENVNEYELFLKKMEEVFSIYLFSWIKKE